MGSWGSKLFQNDVASDVKDEFLRLMHLGKSADEIITEILGDNKQIQNDSDDGPVFWIALATVLWDYGSLTSSVHQRAINQMENLQSKMMAEQHGTDMIDEFTRDLIRCTEKLSEANPKPKKMTRPRQYICPWNIGDLYALKLESQHSVEKGVAGQYLIFHKIGEMRSYPSHRIPVCRAKITTSGTLPQSREELDSLEYVLIGVDALQRGSMYKDGVKCSGDEFYNEYPIFALGLIATSSRSIPKNIIHLGNDVSLAPPALEYRLDNIQESFGCYWKYVEEIVVNRYFSLNKREAIRYHRNK